MPISLNVAATGVVANGYDVGSIALVYDPNGVNPPMVRIVFWTIVASKPVGTPTEFMLTEPVFLAFAGTTPRLKSLAAIASFLALPGGSYTTT